MSTVVCPGCCALVTPITKVLDKHTKRSEFVIPDHNPLPKNKQGANSMDRCPGSRQTVVGYVSPHMALIKRKNKYAA